MRHQIAILPAQQALPGFVVEQAALDVQPSAETSELPACADHTVARHDDGDRIRAVRQTDSA
jgi:hypothetical protein